MKQVAVEAVALADLEERGVHETRLVERVVADLLDDEHAVVDAVPLEQRMQVREQSAEVLAPVAIRQDDREPTARDALSRRRCWTRGQSCDWLWSDWFLSVSLSLGNRRDRDGN